MSQKKIEEALNKILSAGKKEVVVVEAKKAVIQETKENINGFEPLDTMEKMEAHGAVDHLDNGENAHHLKYGNWSILAHKDGRGDHTITAQHDSAWNTKEHKNPIHFQDDQIDLLNSEDDADEVSATIHDKHQIDEYKKKLDKIESDHEKKYPGQTSIDESKKEDEKEEKGEADEVSDEPAVKIDNPIDPDLENDDVDEQGQKKDKIEEDVLEEAKSEAAQAKKESKENVMCSTLYSTFSPIFHSKLINAGYVTSDPEQHPSIKNYKSVHYTKEGSPTYTFSKDYSRNEPFQKLAKDGTYIAGIGTTSWGHQKPEHHVDYIHDVMTELNTLPLKQEDNVQESTLATLFQGETLSEELQTKLETIFKAAVSETVSTQVDAEIARLNEDFTKKEDELIKTLAEQSELSLDEDTQKLTEKIDEYFDTLSEQWIQDNELALEARIRSEMTEEFINEMRGVFSKHYIDLPAEKFDVVNDLQEKLIEAQNQLVAITESSKVLVEEYQTTKRELILEDTTKGMTELDAGKFRKMMEEFEFESADQFSKRSEIIKESFFGKKSSLQESKKEKMEISSKQLNESTEIKEEQTDSISQYASFISKNAKK